MSPHIFVAFSQRQCSSCSVAPHLRRHLVSLAFKFSGKRLWGALMGSFSNSLISRHISILGTFCRSLVLSGEAYSSNCWPVIYFLILEISALWVQSWYNSFSSFGTLPLSLWFVLSSQGHYVHTSFNFLWKAVYQFVLSWLCLGALPQKSSPNLRLHTFSSMISFFWIFIYSCVDLFLCSVICVRVSLVGVSGFWGCKSGYRAHSASSFSLSHLPLARDIWDHIYVYNSVEVNFRLIVRYRLKFQTFLPVASQLFQHQSFCNSLDSVCWGPRAMQVFHLFWWEFC